MKKLTLNLVLVSLGLSLSTQAMALSLTCKELSGSAPVVLNAKFSDDLSILESLKLSGIKLQSNFSQSIIWTDKTDDGQYRHNIEIGYQDLKGGGLLFQQAHIELQIETEEDSLTKVKSDKTLIGGILAKTFDTKIQSTSMLGCQVK